MTLWLTIFEKMVLGEAREEVRRDDALNEEVSHSTAQLLSLSLIQTHPHYHDDLWVVGMSRGK